MAVRCVFFETERSSRQTDQGPAWHLPRRTFLRASLLAGCSQLIRASAEAPADRTATIVDDERVTSQARVIGRDAAKASTPGSTLKPFVVLTAMQQGVLTPQTRIACTRSLRVAGRNLACTHPASINVLDAEQALAYSCNTYFARVSQQLHTSALREGLQRFGIHTQGDIDTPDLRILLALGLQGVRTTPVELARAYARLAGVLQQSDPQAEAIRAGLLGSVSYGMAHAAQTSGVTLGGKTGTAHDPATMLQHGWFAGIVFATSPTSKSQRIVVVYAPGGSGYDAALAAHDYLKSMPWH